MQRGPLAPATHLAGLEMRRHRVVGGFHLPPELIEGQFPSLLAVRDIASGYQLAFAPIPDERGEKAIALLSE